MIIFIWLFWELEIMKLAIKSTIIPKILRKENFFKDPSDSALIGNINKKKMQNKKRRIIFLEEMREILDK